MIDTLWVGVAAALVFLMQAGFLCLEAGLTRTKNSINVAVKNIADFSLSILLFWGFGFALMFGVSRTGWIGASDFVPDLGQGDAWRAAFFFFQAVFCGTAVTIVSGAVAERVRFGGYLLVALIVSGAVYPLFGHWVWGGALHDGAGWLGAMGFVDFAGSTVVHSVGGWVALVCCVVVGPRLGRFGRSGRNRVSPGSNLPLAMLGMLLLWFGWIGFNGGSTLAFNDQVPGIIANTMLACAAGMVTALLCSYVFFRYVEATLLINGGLAGLVAITANCHAVTGLEAVLIGGIGAVVAGAANTLLPRLKIDDVISAVPVHLAAGVWGTLAVALFGDPAVLGTGLTVLEQLGVQAIGVATCGVWCVGVSLPLFYLAHRLVGLRVTAEAERDGLNISEHRATTELLDFVRVVDHTSRTGDLSRRVEAEPFTEVGQLAEHYNRLMAVLEQSKTDIDALHETEQRLQAALDEAQRANDAKSVFLANMSHEMRTPLHAILSFAGFGRKKADRAQPQKVIEYFDKIDVSGQRLLMLVNDLLDLAKLESGRMTFEFARQNVVTCIAGVIDELRSLTSEKGQQIDFDYPDSPVMADIDAQKFMQITRNLIGNAIKFSPRGEKVDVSLRRSDDTLRVTVADRGPGVPDGELTSIFDKFTQSSKTSSGAGGTGLGLSICREFVEAHRGRIWVDHREGGGALFIVEVPLERVGDNTGATPREPERDRAAAAEAAA